MTVAYDQALNQPARDNIAAGRVLDRSQRLEHVIAAHAFVGCRHCLDFAEVTHMFRAKGQASSRRAKPSLLRSQGCHITPAPGKTTIVRFCALKSGPEGTAPWSLAPRPQPSSEEIH